MERLPVSALKLGLAPAAGCTMILKPSPETPLGSYVLAEVAGELVEGRDPEGLAAVLGAAGVPYELLGAQEASARRPQIRFTGPALYHPDAGVVDADASVAACVRRAANPVPM
ncbi:aldehyde dehydrogenase family protein [Streptomyces sp. NPDC004752]